MRSAPWEKGSKTGMRRATESREKADTAATLPVLKKADCRRVRKKSDILASLKVSDRKGEGESEAGSAVLPLTAGFAVLLAAKMRCSHRTQVKSVEENPR